MVREDVGIPRAVCPVEGLCCCRWSQLRPRNVTLMKRKDDCSCHDLPGSSPVLPPCNRKIPSSCPSREQIEDKRGKRRYWGGLGRCCLGPVPPRRSPRRSRSRSCCRRRHGRRADKQCRRRLNKFLDTPCTSLDDLQEHRQEVVAPCAAGVGGGIRIGGQLRVSRGLLCRCEKNGPTTTTTKNREEEEEDDDKGGTMKTRQEKKVEIQTRTNTRQYSNRGRTRIEKTNKKVLKSSGGCPVAGGTRKMKKLDEEGGRGLSRAEENSRDSSRAQEGSLRRTPSFLSTATSPFPSSSEGGYHDEEDTIEVWIYPKLPPLTTSWPSTSTSQPPPVPPRNSPC